MASSCFPILFLSLEESVVISYSKLPDQTSRHSHNFVEFSYVVEGYGVETINQNAFEMKPGYFSIIYPWQTHEVHFNKDCSVKYFFVSISMDNFVGAGRIAIELKDLFLLSTNHSSSNYYFEGSNATKMNHSFEEMYEEFVTRKNWWAQSVKSKMLDVLILFDRQLNYQAERADNNINSHNMKKAQDIVFYIYNNFKDDLSLSFLSKTFGLSENYMSTLIKDSLGVNFSDFIHNLRLKYACTLLASTTIPVTDVAYSSGFQSYRNFERFFKRQYLMSPTKFRETSEENSR